MIAKVNTFVNFEKLLMTFIRSKIGFGCSVQHHELGDSHGEESSILQIGAVVFGIVGNVGIVGIVDFLLDGNVGDDLGTKIDIGWCAKSLG